MTITDGQKLVPVSLAERVRHAERVEEELIAEISKLPVREQEKLLAELRERNAS